MKRFHSASIRCVLPLSCLNYTVVPSQRAGWVTGFVTGADWEAVTLEQPCLQ